MVGKDDFMAHHGMIWDADAINDYCLCFAKQDATCQLDNDDSGRSVAEGTQFDKFLWFVTDGFAFKFAHPGLEEFQQHAVVNTLYVVCSWVTNDVIRMLRS